MTKKDPLAGLLSWHWSQDPPSAYVTHKIEGGYGIGLIAAVHPGAFNLAWALIGAPTAKQYIDAVFSDSVPQVSISWLPAAAHEGLCIHTPKDRSRHVSENNAVHWAPLDRASQLSMSEYLFELTEERNLSIFNMTGANISQAILAAHKHR